MKEFKVRITKSSGFAYWYANKIGEVYTVEDKGSCDNQDYTLTGTEFGIAKCDCEIVSDSNSQKEVIVKQIDDLSLEIEKLKIELNHIENTYTYDQLVAGEAPAGVYSISNAKSKVVILESESNRCLLIRFADNSYSSLSSDAWNHCKFTLIRKFNSRCVNLNSIV